MSLSNIVSLFRRLLHCAGMMTILSLSAVAQNYSGLQGKELTQDNLRDAIVGSILGAILDGSIPGDVEKVNVIEDYETLLKIRLKYHGFESGGFVTMTITDENLLPLKGFNPQTAAITPEVKDVEVTLSMDPGSYPENEPFTAPRLVIIMSKTEDGSKGVKRVFKLNKKFVNPLTAENIIIPVALSPVGSAASLPAALPSQNSAIPRTNVYKAIKNKAFYMEQRIQPAGTTISPAARAAATERVAVSPALASESVLKARHLYRVSPGTGTTTVNTEPQGPDNKPVSFWGDFIFSDVDFESQMDISNVNLNIYPDKNPNSGVFYYLPIAYDIKYDPERGFAFNVDYGSARGEESQEKVRMSGILSSGISLYEIQFIKNLMETYKKQNPGLKLERPMPLPVSETPQITLGDELKNFGIASVNINNVNSITDPIEFSWQTDGTTAAELENLLRVNSGIIGKMKVKSTSEDLPMQEIPVRIRLIDENTFGRFGMLPSDMRNKTWRNETPFPVRLKYVHYMIIDKTGNGKESPIIYSWDLGNQEVQPSNQVKFDMTTVPSWLDTYKGKQARVWIDYSVVESCTPCNEKVFSGIISSTSRPQLSNVVFRVIEFFETYNVAYLDVEVKSIQGDPNGRTETTFPVLHITADKADYTAGKIYVPNGGSPSFDYRVTVVTQDGAELKSDWINRTSTSVPFGSFQLEELFPSLKK